MTIWLVQENWQTLFQFATNFRQGAVPDVKYLMLPQVEGLMSLYTAMMLFKAKFTEGTFPLGLKGAVSFWSKVKKPLLASLHVV